MLETQKSACPYCGERIEVVLDLSVEHQEYIEDCFVCCRPIVFSVWADATTGTAELNLATENDG